MVTSLLFALLLLLDEVDVDDGVVFIFEMMGLTRESVGVETIVFVTDDEFSFEEVTCI